MHWWIKWNLFTKVAVKKKRVRKKKERVKKGESVRKDKTRVFQIIATPTRSLDRFFFFFFSKSDNRSYHSLILPQANLPLKKNPLYQYLSFFLSLSTPLTGQLPNFNYAFKILCLRFQRRLILDFRVFNRNLLIKSIKLAWRGFFVPSN